jgi:hypothetical protein
MRIRHTLVTLSLTIGLLAACGNEVEVSPAEPASTAVSAAKASPEVRSLVAEIDSMLVVPQDQYPNGGELSAVFERLLDAVFKEKRTLRTDRVTKHLGYFIASGHGIGWNPQEDDIERLGRDWRELRPDVLAGP